MTSNDADLRFQFQGVLDSIDSGESCPIETEECLRAAVRRVMGCPDGCPYVTETESIDVCPSCGERYKPEGGG